MSTPSIRGFQLDGSAIGNAAKSVNLYRGDVNLPLKLVDLKGPHGLDLSLAGYYSSNVDQQWDTWNLEAPTGVLGLGWSLPFSYIGFSGLGTASWLEGSFTLNIGGNAHPLVMLSYTGTATAGDESLTFADPLNPLWTFSYTPGTESWEVIRDDGVTMAFGDQNAGRGTVQGGVRWDNWAGNSSSGNGNPQPFAVAWNLSTLSNPWDQCITYTYLLDTQPVTSKLSYTRACYLKEIVDGYGRTVVFSYGDKEPLEYQAPHTIAGNTPTAGYQDRYETRYLARIDVYSPGGLAAANLYYSLVPTYQLSDPGNSELTNTCKRYLVSLAQERNGIELLPAMRFAYQLDTGKSGPGRLETVTYPSGGTVSWTYADVPLADPKEPDNIFNLTYTAERPSDSAYAGATPRLWFGSDYVIVAWYTNGNLALRVYSYGGRWSEPYCYDLEGVNPQVPGGSDSTDANRLQQVRLAMGPDFFALHYHNKGNSTDKLHLFQKAIDQFGLWTPTEYSCDLGGTNVTPEETTLVAGNDFAALHVGGTSHLFRFRYCPVTQDWTADDPISHNNSATHIALAARNNTLAACYLAGSGAVRGESVIYYLKGDYTWGEFSQFDSTESFTWDSSFVDSYWRFGQGFVVGTCVTGTSSSTAHLQLIKWQRNFAGFSLSTQTVNNGTQDTIVGGNAVFNAGKLYRYIGGAWVEGSVGWEATDLVAATDDAVLRLRRQGSYYNENELVTFDAQSNTWSTKSFQTDSDLEAFAYDSEPQFSGDFLSASNCIFYRGTDNDWQPVGTYSPLPHCYGSTVANLGPGFIAWQSDDNRNNPDPGALASYAALPKNGDLLSVSAPYSGQKVQSLDGATVLCGANAFATYDADISEFSHVGEFTLHRVLNHKLSDQTACAVVGLAIDTGQQTLKTRYDYDYTDAVFDQSGSVVQFPTVTATQISAVDGSDLGQTVYQYYNGQTSANAVAQTAEICLVGCGEPDSLCAHYSLANGYLYTVTTYDSSGLEVASMVNTWTPVTYDNTFTPLQQVTTLRSGSVTHSFPNLAVTNLDGTADSGATATLSQTQSFTYDPATSRVLQNSFSQYNSRGEQETRSVAYTYAWTQYPGMKSARRLKELCKTVFSTTVNISTSPVQALVQTFTDNWGEAGPCWDNQASWSWLGAGTPDFDFTQATHDGWVCESSVTDRNANGFKTLATDALDTPTLTLFDASGLWPIAKLVNTDIALFCSFETYEDVSGWNLSGGAVIQSGDAHSGRRCVHLPQGSTAANKALTVDSGQWVFACRIKSLGTTNAKWTLTTGPDSTGLSVPSTSDWQYLFTYLTVSKDASAVALNLSNSGGGTLLLDEIRFAPLTCDFSARVYDSDTWYPVAKLGSNGETTRSFYDDRLRVIAAAGPDENLNTIQSLYYSDAGLDMFGAPSPKPNSSLRIKAADGGPWDDFRDTDWQSRWSGEASAWQVVDQVLTLQTGSQETVTLNGSDAYRNYAVQVRVTTGATPTGNLGIQVGDALSVQWNSGQQQWQMRVGGTLVDSAPGAVGTTMHWLLVAGASGILFCLNDEPLLSYAEADGIGGSLGLFAAAAGVGFSQVLIALSPITHLSYLDGTHQAVQGQQLADNQIIVQQTLFDELGRATIHTKPAIYDKTVAGYQADFVKDFDYSTGVMTGDINDYYAGQDGRSNDQGYPYTRKTIEDSTLARPLAQGKPGKSYAIGADGSRITQFSYGVNGSSALFTGSAEQQYKLGLTIDPEGNTTASLTDLLGNVVGHVRGGAGLPAGSLTSACLQDQQDNPAERRSPNAFTPPSGEADDWTETGGFDYHNRPLDHASSDEGRTEAVRDSQGRLRFRLIADSAAASAINPCHDQTATPVTILYAKYDPLGRITEQGRICVASWDEVAEYANDQDWPQNASDWRYRRSYDGDGSQPYCIGRATTMQTHNDGTVATETYQYNIRGKVIRYNVDDGSDSALTTTFSYDCLGRPTGVTYPAMGSLDALSVVYAYNARGLPASIGTDSDPIRYASYSYNAAGQPETVVLGAGGSDPITRRFTYSSAGWPRSISDSGSGGTISTETLYYDQHNADASNSPRYDSLLSAVSYSRAADGADYRWTYNYDNTGRLTSAALKGDNPRQYSYDGNGNLTSLTVGDDTTTLTYNSSNVLQSSGSKVFSSAPSGEVTNAGSQSFAYDFNTRLTTAVGDSSSGNTLAITYGSSAQRLRKQVTDAGGSPLSWRRYLPGPEQRSLQEQHWDATSGQTREVRYIYGAHGIVALESNGSDYFLLQDHERSPRLLLTGAAAAPAALFDYLPFGETLKTGGSVPDLLVYRYTGQEWDAQTGLYNYRHRLYDPTIARFYAPDPQRQYFSPYIYVGDHPLLLTDPSGEFGIGNIAGIIQSSEQIAAGGLLVGIGACMGSTAVMAAGGALIGGGAMTMDYSVRAKHFSESKFLQVDAAATIATAEFEAGVLLTDESGGIGLAAGTGALTGAGGAGYADVFKQVNSDPDAKFDWGEWGIAEGTGAITGAVAGGVGYGIGSAMGVMGGDVADFTATQSEEVMSRASMDVQDGSLPSPRKIYWGRIFAKTTGRFVGAMAGEAFNYGMTAWYRGTRVHAGQWILDSLVVGGEQAATQFATGLVFEAYTPESDVGKAAYGIFKRAVRTGISTGWSYLVKLP